MNTLEEFYNKGECDNWDYSISLVRCIATISIVACHIMQYLDCELAWWFNVGVQIFFCMSGFLYANRKIDSFIAFYKRTYKKILIDYYVVIIPAIIIYVIFQPELILSSAITIPKLLLTLETIPGGTHLWFILSILFCYFLTPLFIECAEYSSKCKGLKLILLIGLQLLLILYVLIVFLGNRFNPAWISTYYIGIILGKLKDLDIRLYKLVVKICSIIALLLNIVQICTDYLSIDLYTYLTCGCLPSYYELFCNYAHAFLGITLFVLLKYIFVVLGTNERNKGAFEKIARISDTYSYDCYLVHHWFILGPFSLMGMTYNIIFNIVVICLLIVVTTIVVHTVSMKLKSL